MTRKCLPYLFLLMGLILFSCTRSHVENVALHDNWKYKHPDSAHWNKATIPGSVHLDLLNDGFIEEPFYGNNEQSLQWIGETDWEYKTQIQKSDYFDMDRVELVFEGLDTYADVYLNDVLVLSADNMFRTWVLDIKSKLTPSENNLYIRFYAPSRIERDKEAKVNYRLPEIRGFTRKSPYHYGWDWGPTFKTSGLWRNVYLRAWDEVRIEDVQTNLKKLETSIAQYSAQLEIQSVGEVEANLEFLINEQAQDISLEKIRLEDGLNRINFDFSIENPQLWWPNGLGDQPLYKLSFTIKTNNAEDNKKLKLGVRQIELVTNKDSIGENFYFKVNGHAVFMKGANYIPQDNFLTRVDDEKYRQTLQTAVDANMNMLRVWGGGVYEKDIFYDLCDEMGLLVWQDFMFACNMYPGDEKFLENVKQEAIQNVKRLRNHPSIAIWCGNNEVSEGWYNWGWQSSLGYSEEDSLEVWNAYLSIFEDILPGVIRDFDQDRPYWPSSPSTGWGHEQALYSGDMHYWGVWWGEEPFEVYEKKVGRFMTEYGFQGFPNLNTLDSCLEKKDLNLKSDQLQNHQKHPRGMELIRMYMEREYPIPEDFKQYAYVSQLVQAYGIKTALEAHRRAKPYCMGTLYWQLNDCWPVISWSSVDYYNRWKALHYFTKKIFDPLIISFKKKENQIQVYIISDHLEKIDSKLVLQLIDFSGKVLWQDSARVSIDANSSKVYFSTSYNDILKGVDVESTMLVASLNDGKPIVTSSVYYFVRAKDLNLPDKKINIRTTADETGHSIFLSTDKLIKNVCLLIDEEGHFSDNYFDLLPGDSICVKYTPGNPNGINGTKGDFNKRLQIISLNDL